VSERIVIARFKTRIRNVAVTQCYAPTEVTELNIKRGILPTVKAYPRESFKERH
jgi:hypothetical protein